MKKPLSICSLLALIFSTVTFVKAQENVLESDPLVARELLIYDQIGGYVGPSFNSQGGTFITDCNCEFNGGAATGFAVGGMFERLTRSRFRWGAMLGYSDKSVEGRFLEIEGVSQTATSINRTYVVPITFRNVASVSIHQIDFTPYVKYTAFKFLSLRGGVQASYIFASSLKHTKELLTDSVSLPNGEVARIKLEGTEDKQVVLQDGPVSDLNQLQINLMLAAGLDFKLTKKFYLSPVLQFLQPLTTVSGRGDNFTSRSVQLLVEARFIF